MRTFESEPMQMPTARVHTRSTGTKPSPRFASVVGHAQMRAPAWASRSSSAPSAWVACTTVVRSLRHPVRARSSIGRMPCSATHSSISRGCSSAWTCSGSSSVAAYRPISSSHDAVTARTEWGARQMATRVVPAPLQLLPNALTVARLILIPVFVALMLSAEKGHSWAAGIVFGIAGITDQIDGFRARRWHVESEFGRIFDPLADRLMIDAAVILLYLADHMPLAGLIVILGRDVLLLAGYKAIAPQGYELNVNLIGKAATWLLYAG